MKRLLLAVAALVVLWLAGRALVSALASDETRIRWRIEAMRDGYNEGDLGDVVAPIHDDWRHAGSSVDRELLKAGLLREFLQERRSRSKQLVRRVEIVPDSLTIEIGEDEARLEVELSFSRLQGDDSWKESWRALVEAELLRSDGRWLVHRSRHEDLAGSRRAR